MLRRGHVRWSSSHRYFPELGEPVPLSYLDPNTEAAHTQGNSSEFLAVVQKPWRVQREVTPGSPSGFRVVLPQ